MRMSAPRPPRLETPVNPGTGSGWEYRRAARIASTLAGRGGANEAEHQNGIYVCAERGFRGMDSSLRVCRVSDRVWQPGSASGGGIETKSKRRTAPRRLGGDHRHRPEPVHRRRSRTDLYRPALPQPQTARQRPGSQIPARWRRRPVARPARRADQTPSVGLRRQSVPQQHRR